MNAPLTSRHVARLLKAGYDHEGLALDLYGTLEEDGYSVTFVAIPGSDTCIPASADLRSLMSAHLDEDLPTAEELRKEAEGEARIDRFVEARTETVGPYWSPH